LAGDKVLHEAGDGQRNERTDGRKGERTDGRTDRHDKPHNFFGTFVKKCAFVNRENWINFFKIQKFLE